MERVKAVQSTLAGRSGIHVVLCKGRFAGPISGADETLVTYATQLHRSGQRVSVALLYPHAAADPYALRLQEAGIAVSCIAPDSKMRAFLFAVRGRLTHLPNGPRRVLQKTAASVSSRYEQACRKYFERADVDVLHVVTPDPASMTIIRAAHATDIPVLYQELGTPDYLPELDLYYRQLQRVLPLCNEVAALSPSLAARFAQKFDCAQPGVLPLIVEECNVSNSERVRTSQESPHAPVRFGFSARLEYGKGPLLLIEAFSHLCRHSNLNLQLEIAGGGIQESEMQDMVAAHGLSQRCHFRGLYSGTQQRSQWMRELDVFVLPSLAEGTPNSIIEAMSQGLPTVASAVGGIPDVLGDDCGILVPPGNVEALSDALQQLAHDAQRRACMGQAARQRYSQLFSPEAVLPLLQSTYERLTRYRTNHSATGQPGSLPSVLPTPERDEASAINAHPWFNS